MSFLTVTPAERMVVPQVVLIDRKGFIHYQTLPIAARNGTPWPKIPICASTSTN